MRHNRLQRGRRLVERKLPSGLRVQVEYRTEPARNRQRITLDRTRGRDAGPVVRQRSQCHLAKTTSASRVHRNRSSVRLDTERAHCIEH